MAYKRVALVRGTPHVAWVESFKGAKREDDGFIARSEATSAFGFGTSIEEAVDDLGVRAGSAR